MNRNDQRLAKKKLEWMERQFNHLAETFKPPTEGGQYENHCRWAAARALAVVGIELLDDGTCRWKDYTCCNNQYIEPW